MLTDATGVGVGVAAVDWDSIATAAGVAVGAGTVMFLVADLICFTSPPWVYTAVT